MCVLVLRSACKCIIVKCLSPLFFFYGALCILSPGGRVGMVPVALSQPTWKTAINKLAIWMSQNKRHLICPDVPEMSWADIAPVCHSNFPQQQLSLYTRVSNEGENKTKNEREERREENNMEQKSLFHRQDEITQRKHNKRTVPWKWKLRIITFFPSFPHLLMSSLHRL